MKFIRQIAFCAFALAANSCFAFWGFGEDDEIAKDLLSQDYAVAKASLQKIAQQNIPAQKKNEKYWKIVEGKSLSGNEEVQYNERIILAAFDGISDADKFSTLKFKMWNRVKMQALIGRLGSSERVAFNLLNNKDTWNSSDWRVYQNTDEFKCWLLMQKFGTSIYAQKAIEQLGYGWNLIKGMKDCNLLFELCEKSDALDIRAAAIVRINELQTELDSTGVQKFVACRDQIIAQIVQKSNEARDKDGKLVVYDYYRGMPAECAMCLNKLRDAKVAEFVEYRASKCGSVDLMAISGPILRMYGCLGNDYMTDVALFVKSLGAKVDKLEEDRGMIVLSCGLNDLLIFMKKNNKLEGVGFYNQISYKARREASEETEKALYTALLTHTPMTLQNGQWKQFKWSPQDAPAHPLSQKPVEETRDRCVRCGSRSYGPGCSGNNSYNHKHQSGEGKCIWCGRKSYGSGCDYGPGGMHEH